jgi:hypothetical protein
MDLNKGNMGLGDGNGSRTGQSALKDLVQTLHSSKRSSICVKCMNAPAFEVRRRAVAKAAFSIETVKGNAQAAHIRTQLR